jgi:dipeptidyl aminopeptidase/acylaminoacyl peptidase
MPGDVQVSPDGSQCAFVLVRMDRDQNVQKASIWIVPSDGSAPARRLTSGPRRDAMPRWSPDGRWLAFLSNREAEWRADLYVIDRRGAEPRMVAHLPRGIDAYAWAPDSNRFALVGRPDYPVDPDRDPPKDAEDAHRRYGERVRHVSRFRYRLDGSGLLDDEPRRLWICARDGGAKSAPTPITEGPWEVLRPRWTPDGRIAFTSNRNPDHQSSEKEDLWVVSPDGGEPSKLTTEPGSIASFSLGPQGQCALIGAFDDHAFGSARNMRVFVDLYSSAGRMGPADLKLRTAGFDRTAIDAVMADSVAPADPHDPVWSPDGSLLHFLVSDAGAVGIYRMAAEGEPALFVGGQRVIPSFSIGGRTVAFISTSPDDPGTIRAVDPDGSFEGVLHDPNPWVKERGLGSLRDLPVEVDGTKVDGWALLPPDHADGTTVPTLLYIHGGPHMAYGWSFALVFQVLAGAGYAVLYCNPPGSQAYGERFARALIGHWGEADFPFFMALVDRALESGFADPERLGVGGASYGGFSTLWVVTHTDRFKAAVSARPVSMLESFYGSSDIGWAFGAREMGAEPWEEPDQYRRLSPALKLQRVTTPLRLIACLSDHRTPPEQAEQVFIRLKKMGKETDLVLFFGEPHAIVVVGKPWNRVRHMRAIVEWFDRFLRPDQ